MIRFNVAGFLTDFTEGRSQIVVESGAGTVGEALNDLWRQHVGLRDRVVNEQGTLRPHVNIFLNDENVRRQQMLDTTIQDGCEITILPSVSGGEATEARRRRSEVGDQRSEVRGRRSEVGDRRSEIGGQTSENRDRTSDIDRPTSDVRCLTSDLRSPISDVRPPISDF